MARKARSAALDYAVYLAVRTLVCVVQALPPAAARGLGELLGWIAWRVDRRHRLVADENLQHAFPGRWDDAERGRVVAAVYRHFGLLLAEIIRLPRMLHVHNWRRYADLVHGERTLDLLLSDRPVLIVTAHFGNWELAGYTLNLLGFRSHAIARTLDNPYLDDFLRAFRERTGQKVLAKNGEYELIEGVLASGGTLATLADQDAGQRGLFVEFFGRPASTHKAVALMALQFNVPIVVAGAVRDGEPMHYQIVAEDVIRPEEYAGSRAEAVTAITQRYTAAIERLVRRSPEQYFWVHRRWKHQPVVRKKKAAA
jgi:KDO2-lipid IV(A) lauroyltransferase